MLKLPNNAEESLYNNLCTKFRVHQGTNFEVWLLPGSCVQQRPGVLATQSPVQGASLAGAGVPSHVGESLI